MAGHQVEWFTASFPGASNNEVVDGIQVVRKGRQWTVHVHAFLHYRGRLRDRFDVVIDQINTIPFLTPLWADIPTFVMIWQLAREVWWYESRFPLSLVGFALEPVYLRAYRGTPALTFGQSTAADLRGLGFRGAITVLPVGLEPIEAPRSPKEADPLFVYVGRLAPSKRVHEIVEALALFREQTGCGRLQLIGNGPLQYVNRLKNDALRLGLGDAMEFCGWLSGPRKHQRMAEARALLMASVREGWGLVVSEANACGTPAIVYDVPGLHDSVRNGLTGLVVQPGPTNMCDAMVRIVNDPQLYARLVAEGKRWSRTFSFDETARLVIETLDGALVA